MMWVVIALACFVALFFWFRRKNQPQAEDFDDTPLLVISIPATQCRECSRELVADAQFCIHCGTAVADAQSDSATSWQTRLAEHNTQVSERVAAQHGKLKPIKHKARPPSAVEPTPSPAKIQQPTKPSRRKSSRSAPLDEVEFTYRKRDAGAYETRRVSVRAVDGEYLEGYCHLRQQSRTFALKRIRGKITSLETGEVSNVWQWSAEMQQHPGNGTVNSGKDYRAASRKPRHAREWQTAVFFVGFRESSRRKLEALAEQAGWQVRMGFSDTLDVMVAGSLAGEKQFENATATGVEVLSESAFMSRIGS